MEMKKLIVFIVILCFSGFALADYVPYKHSVDINVGGPASALSAEYQYHLVVNGLHTVGVSGGMGIVQDGYSFPLGMQYRFGEIHQLELGAHLTPIFIQDPNLKFKIVLSGRLGYRINIYRFFMHISLLPSYPKEYASASLGLGFYLGHAILGRKI
jgi:hypothetical protein